MPESIPRANWPGEVFDMDGENLAELTGLAESWPGDLIRRYGPQESERSNPVMAGMF